MNSKVDSNSHRSGCLAVIPARFGSKRIRNKNIRPFHGKPIVAYTIEAALKSELFDRVVVSTDNQAVAEIALEYGAEVPFLRASNLSDDFTPVSDVTRDALFRLDKRGDNYTHVAQLLPNCPLRTDSDIVKSYKAFVNADAEAMISVVRFGWLNPWWAMKLGTNLNLEPLFSTETKSRSQDLDPLFCPTGAIWWIKSSVLVSANTFYVPGAIGWEMPWYRGIDIDDEDDWQLAKVIKQVIENEMFDSAIEI